MYIITFGLPDGSAGKESACGAEDTGDSPGWEGPLKEEIATCSSILSWRIPWTEEPGGLQSMGSQRVGHDWALLLPSLSKMGRGQGKREIGPTKQLHASIVAICNFWFLSRNEILIQLLTGVSICHIKTGHLWPRIVCYYSFLFSSYFWLCWVFVALGGFSLVVAVDAAPQCGAWASHCSGFSCVEHRL